MKDLVITLLSRIKALEAENATLKSENADLRLRLHKNSNNSHKPPSSDGLTKKPALAKPIGKKTADNMGIKARP